MAATLCRCNGMKINRRREKKRGERRDSRVPPSLLLLRGKQGRTRNCEKEKEGRGTCCVSCSVNITHNLN